MPKVSIVLPTYNGQEFIKESIESIINQTFQEWELIIVNDCSTDNTPEILKEYEQLDERIRVINNKENQKLPQSLNIGFQEAKGVYLTWTSDDNIYLPRAIEKMIDFFDANPKEYMVCTRMNFISENGEFEYISSLYANEYMCYGNYVGACFLYRRTVIDEIGEYNPDLFLVEDYDYWLRILFRYKNIGFINEVLYLYRSHSNSLTSTRMKEIKFYSAKMKRNYFNQIINFSEGRKELLCRSYYEIIHDYQCDEKLREQVSEYVDEIKLETETEIENEVIVYGAGKIGQKFGLLYKDRIFKYVDKDDNKIGKQLYGIDIISIKEMKRLEDKYQIVVAVGIDKVYDVLSTLKKWQVSGCYIYKNEW